MFLYKRLPKHALGMMPPKLQNGLVGIDMPGIDPLDHRVVFEGSPVAFALRQHEDCHGLIGQIYVGGLMRGLSKQDILPGMRYQINSFVIH